LLGPAYTFATVKIGFVGSIPTCGIMESCRLSDDKLAIWNPNNPETTALIYTPPEDNMKRLYNAP